MQSQSGNTNTVHLENQSIQETENSIGGSDYDNEEYFDEEDFNSQEHDVNVQETDDLEVIGGTQSTIDDFDPLTILTELKKDLQQSIDDNKLVGSRDQQ